MLLRAAADLDLELPRSWMIGDRLLDMQAGRAAGCRCVLVPGVPAHEPPEDFSSVPLEYRAGDLRDAARFILAARDAPAARAASSR